MSAVAVLHRSGDFEDVAPAWREILDQIEDPSPFQFPEWLLPWWTAFGADRLHVCVSRAGSTVHGLAPFYARPAAAGGPHALVLVGTGNSDALDVIADPSCDTGALIARAVAEAARNGWRCEWCRLPASSPLLRVPRGADGTVTPEVPCVELPLPASDAAFDARLHGPFRRKLRAAQRHAERIGPVTFERLSGDEVRRGLDDLFALHAARWAPHGSGVLGDPAVQRFHRHAAAAFDRAGMLRLARMRIGGDVAAVYYGFQTRRRASFYIGGFNPRFASVSPGSLVIRHLVHAAIDEGVAVFDFLSGQEPYKYAWGARDRPFFARAIEPGALAMPA